MLTSYSIYKVSTTRRDTEKESNRRRCCWCDAFLHKGRLRCGGGTGRANGSKSLLAPALCVLQGREVREAIWISFLCCGIKAQLRPRPPNCWGSYNTLTPGRSPLNNRSAVYTTNTHPCAQQDSNLRPQHPTHHSSKPQSAQPTGSACECNIRNK